MINVSLFFLTLCDFRLFLDISFRTLLERFSFFFVECRFCFLFYY